MWYLNRLMDQNLIAAIIIIWFANYNQYEGKINLANCSTETTVIILKEFSKEFEEMNSINL